MCTVQETISCSKNSHKKITVRLISTKVLTHITVKNQKQTIEFFMLGVSDNLTDLRLHSTKKKFIKNCPLWGLNSQPPDHQSHALVTELGKNLLEMSEVSFILFHAPLHMLDIFIARINRA